MITLLLIKLKQKLEGLREAAANNSEMTYAQKGAITSRVDNYLAGKYGEQVKRADYRSDYSKKLV